jgi:hypothetical protein
METIKIKEYILCAAIHVKDGIKHEHQPKNIETGFVVCGRRHHNCYATLSIMGDEKYSKLMVGREGQGFITNTDRYVDRKEGYYIAYAANQILLNYHEDLYSEDLY